MCCHTCVASDHPPKQPRYHSIKKLYNTSTKRPMTYRPSSSVACLKVHVTNPHFPFQKFRNFPSVVQIQQKHWYTHLALCMLPRSVYGIHWKNFHAQPSLDAKHYNMQALAVTNLKSWMVQFIGNYFEVQARILQPEKQENSQLSTL